MRYLKSMGVMLAVAGILWPGAASAMNKAELIDAIAKDAKLTKVDAGNALNAFAAATAGALKIGDRLSLVGFGSFSVSKRVNQPDGCGTSSDVDFVAGDMFKHTNPAFQQNELAGEMPIESIQGNDDGTVTAYGQAKGTFTTGDEIIVLDDKDGSERIAVVAGVLIYGADGSLVMADKGTGDEVAGLNLRGIEKSDIRRGMVIAKPGIADDCPDEKLIVRDEEFIERMAKEGKLTGRVAALAFESIVAIIAEVVNTGEEVDLEEFGTFYEGAEVSLAHEAAHVVQQRGGRDPQTGKEIKIAAKGLSDKDLDQLTQSAEVLLRKGNPQTGKEIKIAAKKVAKFKAGKALAETVK
jgi:nucleoid DNA-binding protein